MSHPDAKGYLLRLNETQSDVKKKTKKKQVSILRPRNKKRLDAHYCRQNVMPAGKKTTKKSLEKLHTGDLPSQDEAQVIR